jgi:hypothetical protein
MEVADQGRRAARVAHALLDLGHGRCRLRQIDGDAHELRSRFGQLDALSCRGHRVGGVGHRH